VQVVMDQVFRDGVVAQGSSLFVRSSGTVRQSTNDCIAADGEDMYAPAEAVSGDLACSLQVFDVLKADKIVLEDGALEHIAAKFGGQQE
jgi:ribosomal protein L4